MSYFDYYLIAINVIGFLLYVINTWLYSNFTGRQVDTFLTITSLLGGSLGIVIAIMTIDRKAEKGNMMSRVFVFSILVIQVIGFLVLRGQIKNQITFAVWKFFDQHKTLIIYLVAINFVAFAAFAVDKINAIQHRPRIRNVSLLGLTFLGGSIGGLVAMYTFQHKINKDYYTVGIPIIIAMQIVVIFYLMNLT